MGQQRQGQEAQRTVAGGHLAADVADDRPGQHEHPRLPTPREKTPRMAPTARARTFWPKMRSGRRAAIELQLRQRLTAFAAGHDAAEFGRQRIAGGEEGADDQSAAGGHDGGKKGGAQGGQQAEEIAVPGAQARQAPLVGGAAAELVPELAQRPTQAHAVNVPSQQLLAVEERHPHTHENAGDNDQRRHQQPETGLIAPEHHRRFKLDQQGHGHDDEAGQQVGGADAGCLAGDHHCAGDHDHRLDGWSGATTSRSMSSASTGPSVGCRCRWYRR